MLVTGYLNVYRSGYYHRKGKPRCCDRHAGDIYLTFEDAKQDIDPISHYIATVPVQWHEASLPVANPIDSTPIRLGLTRKEAIAA